MTDVRLHPNTNLLLDYSSGGLSPAQAIAISAHLFYCPHCQAKAGTLNEIGGSLLADCQPISVSSSCRASVMSLLDAADDGEEVQPPQTNQEIALDPRWRDMPPLVKRLHSKGVDWRRLSSSLKVARLAVGERQFELALHQIKAGGKAPAHDHRGLEITVVLQGSFSDDEGVYHQGDYITREPGHIHMPVATANRECICLSVLEAPIRLVGGVSRLLNPFLSFEPA